MASKSIFPDEIITEILIKLPVKSILQCKTLSKHYYSLIQSQFFIRRHLALGRLTNQSIISPIIRGSVRLFDRRDHILVLQVPPPFAEDSSSNYYGHVVCDPVEGLYWVVDPMNDRFAIWNPSTTEQFILPPLPPISNSDAKSFNIFDISKGEWRSVKEWSGVVLTDIRYCIGVFVHGALHWEYASSGFPGFMILAFDMVTESHKFISLPMVGNEYVWSDAFIVSFNGCLGLVNPQNGDNMPGMFSSFDVWVMAEYGVTQSWTILFRVALPDGISGRYLGIVRDRFYIRKGDRCVVSYDLYSKDEERYDIMDNEIGSLLPYQESLVRIISS